MQVAAAKETIFQVNDLNLWYDDFHALKDVSLEALNNEIYAIIGPSGCGKSTFIKTLNLMINMEPGVKMTGEINYKNKNLLDSRVDLVDLRRKVGMIFQKGNPFPQSIYDNIVYGPKIHGIKKKSELDEIVETTLKDVALWDEVKDRLKSSAMGLSGGQQQRLCIARALATKPDVVLMDEPTSALDPISTLKIEELMSELKKKYCIVIVTHNMQQASRISDKTAFFLHGRVVESAETGKIFSNPEDKRTEDYISGRFG
ncbi:MULTISPECIES: phosphate ABC transporter ATP-binding protein PstB [Terribacillus]|jgi:phosphate transport system ATP-binding protein|uniref:Phosphate ABC transporter ATP-binding protein n=1 Tax=Terribacillus saccharophilus TaxID=361277 RepID=A0A1H7ZEP1_9BACI|nr:MULTISPECIES: phosphate ABC transporter ATP-binding protein PstB [Terribacillus]AIF66804.1 phosphate ABC transporter ATP-binding protein [Terribacillus goriensis]MCM3224484.1 phosphate ABC transporter ATP-binding protein PstB [Terribacillus saccharophilus]MEC0283620.1 phosphate ABC transporter ATP-binding protein PstB [Terribacillus saccharophilus]MEC0290576.1 phosphate ABC transporter ATP-binding protein PstB [Terribacillus saccharophilus]MEC0304805.1 phosphate ABC transporter ATP-binding 